MQVILSPLKFVEGFSLQHQSWWTRCCFRPLMQNAHSSCRWWPVKTGSWSWRKGVIPMICAPQRFYFTLQNYDLEYLIFHIVFFEWGGAWERIIGIELFIFCEDLFLLFIYMYLCVCVHMGTCGYQKRALDPLELEFQGVVTCHMGAHTWTPVLWKSKRCS